MNFLTFPRDLLSYLLLFLDGPSLCNFSSTCKALKDICSQDSAWKNILLRENFLTDWVNFHENNSKTKYSFMKDFYVHRKWCEWKAKKLWKEIERFQIREVLISLNTPVSPLECWLLTKNLPKGTSLPEEFRASLMVHDGQDEDLSSFGLIAGLRLLSSNEIRKLYQNMMPHRSTQESHFLVVTSGTYLRRLVIDLRTGEVFLNSGWNNYFKAMNWFELLSQLIPLSAIKFN